MPLPLLAMLALQAAGTAASAYSANRAKKRTDAAMDQAARRASAFQTKPLGNKLAQAYTESKLAENALNPYQKQEAQDLLRAQADADYNISEYAPSGFAAIQGQASNTGRTQDALGRLGAKYAPMQMAQKQQSSQLASEVDKYDYLSEQERKDREQTLVNLGLGKAMAENQNRNQMTQAAIGLGTSMAGTLAGASKEDLNKIFGLGKTTQDFTPTKFASTSGLPKVDATKLYNNAMKPKYNIGGVITKKLNPLQQYATDDISGNYAQPNIFGGPTFNNPWVMPNKKLATDYTLGMFKPTKYEVINSF